STTIVVYNESFLGLSFSSMPDLILLRYLLYIISYSDLVLFHQLLTSAKFGVERDSALQADFENFPLIGLERAQDFSEDISEVAQSLYRGEQCWEKLEDVVSQMYELTEADNDLIRDTLATELPFTNVRQEANAPPSHEDIQKFVEHFNGIVAPFYDDEFALAQYVPNVKSNGWEFLKIGVSSINEGV